MIIFEPVLYFKNLQNFLNLAQSIVFSNPNFISIKIKKTLTGTDTVNHRRKYLNLQADQILLFVLVTPITVQYRLGEARKAHCPYKQVAIRLMSHLNLWKRFSLKNLGQNTLKIKYVQTLMLIFF
jgi:hypothetical protein